MDELLVRDNFMSLFFIVSKNVIRYVFMYGFLAST
jgi:hypothetical protein